MNVRTVVRPRPASEDSQQMYVRFLHYFLSLVTELLFFFACHSATVFNHVTDCVEYRSDNEGNSAGGRWFVIEFVP